MVMKRTFRKIVHLTFKTPIFYLPDSRKQRTWMHNRLQ